LAQYQDKLGSWFFEEGLLRILPDFDSPYFLNVDGLLKKVCKEIEYNLFGKIKLITG